LDSQLVLVYLLVLVLAHQLALVLALEPVVVAKFLRVQLKTSDFLKDLLVLGSLLALDGQQVEALVQEQVLLR
jgi:hypothetical protein